MSAIAPTQYRSFLSGPQKAAYRKIAEELFALKTTVLFDAPVSPKDADAAVRAVHRDHPELFYVDFWTYRKAVLPGTGRCLGVMFDLLLSDMRFITSGVHRAENSIQDMRQRLKNTPKARLSRAIALEMAKDIRYKEGENANALMYHSIYGALSDGLSVCEGIAKLYLLYCQHMEVPCALVMGKLGGTPHAWNIVESRGRPLYIDVTSLICSAAKGPVLQPVLMNPARLRLMGYEGDEPGIEELAAEPRGSEKAGA
ncbi:MAG: hypothetical protein IJM17_09070 [Firmicutes bacterium]|nr:hypothetical protein [Bacillota bacterium]